MQTNRRGALSALVVAMALAILPACDPDAEKEPDPAPENRKGRITGTVQMADGASPAGVELHLYETDVRATTNAQGTFAFEGLNAGTYTLAISKTGYQSQQDSVEVEEKLTTSLAIVMEPGAATSRISGTLTLEGATSHEGVTVSLKDTMFTTTTNAQGAFVLEGVPSGAFFLVASKEGYATEEKLVIVMGEPETVTFTLGRPKGSIGGSVTLEGAASGEGVTVTLTGTSFSAQSDSDGIFVMLQVPPGTYSAVASKAGYTSVTQEVTVTAGETAFVSFTLKAGEGFVSLESATAH
ncbi:PEGA domain-containing protein [Corallococcus praedator]|uniref:PEGA domain-containing protein n=1 Tax=Corallococcus praedator TaxID=2316724 RepID=A0ABX9Q5F6_9BACT|nr:MULTISPECIES: carboxypeptidase regulatory-like domain-containing protein [Corallococcus]RKH16032.1 PEGA domain-containing protein [Corallococcus sp. CA047B]RKH30478.1 PEGA domain-containing protein [Corallococcus sp. CA031C]RKH90495.1 PEGA domain-containing protein [Corallococcus praedator]